MSGVTLKRKEATKQRRSTILHAARAVFARKGYSETGVDDITATAGIAKGTLYLYFASKEQLYLEALLEDARRLDLESREAMAAALTWEGGLRAYGEVRFSEFGGHEDFLRIYMAGF